ncbi:MAG: hypothetical protein JWM99_881 [Verrucomicrobiales bacterium]|nr:hypothetical protein [Verrucomicrobiales bacterium]
MPTKSTLFLRMQVLAAFCIALLIPCWNAVSKEASLKPFEQKYCYECHDAETKKGGLDFTTLPFDLDNATNFASWVKVNDRVANGEMPPIKKTRPEPKDLRRFTNQLTSALLAVDRAKVAEQGRAAQRRLNRYEYEDTLRDILSLPYLEVKAFLPEDTESHGFNKIGEALDVSHVQMARYLTASEFALRQAIAPQSARPEKTTKRYYTWDEREFFGKIKIEGPVNRRTFPLIGLDLQTNIMAEAQPKNPKTTNAERREKESMALVVSTYEPTEIRFGGFRAPIAGRYKLKFSGYSVWMGPKFTETAKAKRSEPVTIYAETPPRSLRRVGSFDFNPDPTVRELEVWLLAGETIRPDAARFFRSRPPDFKNPLATKEGMPAVAFTWMEVEGPVVDQWPGAGHKLLFGNLAMQDRPPIITTNRAGMQRRTPTGVDVISTNPEHDSVRLLRQFMQRAYRRPIQEAEVQRFEGIIQNALKKGYNFTDGMIAGYTGVLSSPAFLYFNEQPGRLDDRALAERLSYFLRNSTPDEQLRSLAEHGKLHQSKVLLEQTDRLLNDPGASRFVDSFLDYWLDLRLISGTAPDEELYPDYQLDDLLAESMIGESQLFFSELIKRNLGVTNLVASDFAILNERLATHYGIPDVHGVALRPVKLPPECVRGGLLTEASVLKVTANGTTTSPVKRGVWIMTRILGKPPRPQPASVTAVDPDIRGATTIREQLAKHRNQESCNVCHRDIDPAGFALESFDVMGGWRARYRSVGEGEKVNGSGHNGTLFHFALGQNVDPAGELPDGRKFNDIRELKKLLLKDPDQLARNLAEQLTIYATGASIRFSDRPEIAKIVARNRSEGYGVRSLIHEIVQSDLFLNK